ncbi:MAG TPA: helicase, partial [Gammaproteobacteria bacterium]|nr:helicase [Gammaproteobacteria bacterium]
MSLEMNQPNTTVVPVVEMSAEEISDDILLSENTTECEDNNAENVLSLSQFIDDFGAGLLDAVRRQNPPVFTGESNKQRAAILAGLKRQPFAAQARTVQAVTQLLLDQNERAAIINGEMGCGKSMMGIATATLLHAEGYYRTLVLCPPHLVYKWRREILETVVDAQVIILNGSDTLSKLQALKQQVSDPAMHGPVFYIMGRVRLRMGHHWRLAAVPRRVYQSLSADRDDNLSQWVNQKTVLASCAECGTFVTTPGGQYLRMEDLSPDKKLQCQKCQSPLWTLVHPRQPAPLREQVKQGLCQLPGIGIKMAERLLMQFGEALLSRSLSDNIYQLVQLMDENGRFVFSDNQAKRLERALGSFEMNIGQAGYQASEFIKRYLPKGFFSLLIVDESHEFKNASSAQGQAMGVLASQVDKVLLLTGTLMGGYGDDLFYLLWRILPQRMIEDGFKYNHRGSLGTAAMGFMRKHGVLKEVYKSTEGGNHRTARGKREYVHVSKAPGFSPMGVARYLLPYTAFLKLRDLEQNALPDYQEHFINVAMTAEQADYYHSLEQTLKEYLRKALSRGDHTLLGVVLNCLLAWPDCCFREEVVTHPRAKYTLARVP